MMTTQYFLAVMHVFNKFISGILFLLLALGTTVNAQENLPYLERKVTLSASNESIEIVLQRIAKEGDFTFSYSPLAIENFKPISFNVSNKPIRDLLNNIFDGQAIFKQKGNHIIIKRNEIKEEIKINSFIISGYVTDPDGSEIPNASIFEKKSRESAITNKYGFFNLKIDDKEHSRQINLFVNKSNYKDTIIFVSQTGNSIVNITLIPEEPVEQVVDSFAIQDSLMRADQMAFIKFLLSEEAQINTKNIKDTIYQKYQVSLIPYIGTNMRLSGNTVNDYSFNVFGGYSMGTRKFEMAGLFNIDRDSVKSVQVAGLLNYTGGPLDGFQIGGLANVNLSPVHGFELAGLLNVNFDSLKGAQIGGLVNFNAKNVSGVQVAGLLNTNLGQQTSGSQTAGLLNITAGNSSGFQAAGLMNVCLKKHEGVQISGLINYAKIIKGSQIGILNISDSCSGIPVGLISYVHKGYHQFEVSTDEFYPINLAVRTGVSSFYNILASGMKLDSLENIQWYFGYGLGTAINLGKRWQLNFDLTINQALRANELNSFSPLSRFNITVEKRLSKYISIAAGPTLNYLLYDNSDDYIMELAKNSPSGILFTSSYSNNYQDKAWIGGKFALRFF